MSEFQTPSQKIRHHAWKPWWCDCAEGGDSKAPHAADCYGNQPAFPRLMEALADRRLAEHGETLKNLD